jgi:phosphoglycerol transferase MdoB-like AlkP superfamily enzyme
MSVDQMTDQSVGLLDVPAKRIARLVRRCVPRKPVRSATAWLIVSMLAAGLARHFWNDEGEFANILFTVGVTGALASLLVLMTRRALFAGVLVTVFVVLVVAAAAAKRAVMNMVVHAYDLFFYFSSWSTVSYLWSDQRRYLLGAMVAAAIAALAGWLAYRLDGTRVSRAMSGLALIGFALLAWYGAQSKGERRHMQFYYSNLYVSSFYASWGETLEALWRGALMEAAPEAAASGPFLIPARCPMAARPPHIIMIHQESVVQPSLFPTLRYDHDVDPFFHSADGTLHPLRVETYGGASWLTEFSLLAGVSTHAFGGMRQFVQTFTQNRLKDTLPQALARCGYRNVVFYPMLKNFVSNDRFYNSIGLREIYDLQVQGAKSARERDRFYYGNAMAEMARHFARTGKPLFTYIQTMSAHWPYDYTYLPEMNVPGGGPGTDPEMHEYLRRVSMAKIDYDYLLSELRSRFPRERFLIVHYGDHHPMATRTLLGYGQDTEAEDVALDPMSIGFITYYAAQGVNYRVPPLPQYTTLDVPYLGTLILDLAGLPLSDSHRERKRLMELCRGRYDSCARREEILQFHRRLIDSGVMAAR